MVRRAPARDVNRTSAKTGILELVGVGAHKSSLHRAGSGLSEPGTRVWRDRQETCSARRLQLHSSTARCSVRGRRRASPDRCRRREWRRPWHERRRRPCLATPREWPRRRVATGRREGSARSRRRGPQRRVPDRARRWRRPERARHLTWLAWRLSCRARHDHHAAMDLADANESRRPRLTAPGQVASSRQVPDSSRNVASRVVNTCGARPKAPRTSEHAAGRRVLQTNGAATGRFRLSRRHTPPRHLQLSFARRARLACIA